MDTLWATPPGLWRVNLKLQVSRTGQPWQDSLERTARKGKDSQDRTSRKAQAGQDGQERIPDRTGKRGREIQDRTGPSEHRLNFIYKQNKGIDIPIHFLFFSSGATCTVFPSSISLNILSKSSSGRELRTRPTIKYDHHRCCPLVSGKKNFDFLAFS